MLKYIINNIPIIKTAAIVNNTKFLLTKNIAAINPMLTVAIICAMPPTIVTMAAFILSPFSNINILPRKFPILFGKNIPEVIPVKIERNDFQVFMFSIGLSCIFHLTPSK